MSEEKDLNLDDLLREYEDLESEDDIDMDDLSKLFGFTIEELEKGFEEYSPKLDVGYEMLDEDIKSPSYAYETDSGFDLFSTIDTIIEPLERVLIPTGLKIDIPENYEVQVRTKSGLAFNRGLMVLNSPGTVDQGYTGEIKVILFNASRVQNKIEKGMKIAQAVVCPVINGKWVNLVRKEKVESKDRNENGFGSTGV
jgi:dUTP pyrophosphatase